MPDTEPTTDILPLCAAHPGLRAASFAALVFNLQDGAEMALRPCVLWHQPHERPACRLKGAEKSKRKKRGALRIFSVCFKVILQFPAFFQFFSMRLAPPLPLSLRLLQAPSHNHSAGKPLLRALARPPLSYI